MRGRKKFEVWCGDGDSGTGDDIVCMICSDAGRRSEAFCVLHSVRYRKFTHAKCSRKLYGAYLSHDIRINLDFRIVTIVS